MTSSFLFKNTPESELFVHKWKSVKSESIISGSGMPGASIPIYRWRNWATSNLGGTF